MGVGIGKEIFIIGKKETLQQWAEYKCLELYCVDTMSRKTLEPCEKKFGSEFWVPIHSEDIIKEVKYGFEEIRPEDFE